MENLCEGMLVDISRSDGRIHEAFVSKLSYAENLVSVEWFEHDELKGKDIDIGSIIRHNPTLFHHCKPVPASGPTSGVPVSPDCQNAFQQLSEGKKLRYIIFEIQDKEIVVESSVSSEDLNISEDEYESNSKKAFDTFVKDLKERTDGFNDCRYAVFDFKFTTYRHGVGISKMNKIIFIHLCPDGASIKQKMVYALSAQAIKASIGANRILQFQVSEESEIVHQEMLRKLTARYCDT